MQKAVAVGMTVFALTEHMPRDVEEDLYPEEASTPLRAAHHSKAVSAEMNGNLDCNGHHDSSAHGAV